MRGGREVEIGRRRLPVSNRFYSGSQTFSEDER
jgi:hypothetical protein